jgi:hypothetical protein
MNGNPINFNKFKIDSIFSILDSLKCSSFFHSLSNFIDISQRLLGAIQFLKNISIVDFSAPLTDHLLQAIKLLSSKLKEIPFEDLNSFSLSVLEHIFSCEHLQVSNEDYFVTIISHLIEIDSNRKCLYHFILFLNVSGNLLTKQFFELKVNDLDSNLLEMFKSRLFFD